MKFLLVLLTVGTLVACSSGVGGRAPDPTADALRRRELCVVLACTPTVPVPDKRCAAEDLAGWATFGPDRYNPTPGPIDGLLVLTLKDDAAPCNLSPRQEIAMLVRNGIELLMTIDVAS